MGLSVSISGLVIVSSAGGDITDSEKAFIKRSEFDVDLDFMILKGNKWKCETGVTAEPELKRNVKSSFGECLAWGADSLGNSSETIISQVGQLSSVTNHGVVSLSLFSGEGE